MRNDWFEDDNEIRLLRRGKRRLLDIVFGRTMVITLLLVLQIAIMVLGAHYLGRYYPALTIVLRVLSVAVIIYLVNKSGSATTKITWIILVMALPAFGVLLYLFVQLDIGHRAGEHPQHRAVRPAPDRAHGPPAHRAARGAQPR